MYVITPSKLYMLSADEHNNNFGVLSGGKALMASS